VNRSIPDAWIDAALAPPRAFGATLGRGRLRAEPEDFVVEEDLGFAPSGAGSHVLLKVRKRNANTEWVARELARAAGCRPHDVGYAGLKDRHAITTQWFSVPMPRRPRTADDGPRGEGERSDATIASSTAPAGQNRALADLTAIRSPDFEVLEAHAHAKKLPRGALAGNRFAIRIRDLTVADEPLAERLTAIANSGVPNYFGPQRFGRDAANLENITSNPNAIHPRERTYVLSAARSLIFNAVLAERVRENTWRHLEPGDVANLDARGSVFPVDASDETLQDRMARLDIHPTGPLWGTDEPMSRDRIRALEERVAADFADPCALAIAAGMRQERRSLRLAVRQLDWSREGTDLVLRFWLTKGSFATTVLRELIDTEASASPDDDDAPSR
jgi:tRNA pseudouridine13 synthase